MAEKIIKVKVTELLPGDVIAKDLHNSSGSILIKKDTDVKQEMIERLLKSYHDFLFVYRNVGENFNNNKINISSMMLDEINDIINNTAVKFLKQNKDISQIRKLINEILSSEDIIKLLIPIRALGESVYHHSINVAVYALSIGKEMFLPYNRLKVLGTAAILHDIGMQKIPSEILFKDEPLTDKEKQVIQLHPRIGFEILQNTNKFNIEISTIVLQHHERHDGKGYPNGIKNDKINPMAKLINMCDTFDALTNDRPYRQKFEKYQSIEYVLNAGEYFYSSEMIQALISTISIYPYGQWIKLTTGEVGVVISEDEESSINYRPKVMLLIDADGSELENARIVDLALRINKDISIQKII